MEVRHKDEKLTYYTSLTTSFKNFKYFVNYHSHIIQFLFKWIGKKMFNGLISLQMLLDAGAMVDAEDVEGNTPLHVKCYGESNKPSDLTSIELLLNKNASLSKRNTRVSIACNVLY